jgi:hypothetical protein
VARYNTKSHHPKPPVALATSPIATVSDRPTTRTFEGAKGWTRTPQAELFLRATGAFHGGEATFYESADKRDDRLRELTRRVALEDPTWGFEFAQWLRGPGNMRTASLMFAVEYVKGRLDVGTPDESDRERGLNRRIIDAVCQRPDEPGELLAIWTAWYGRRIPKPVKRGLADATQRLYHQKSLLKYDTASHAFRFADVLNLVHPSPAPEEPLQGELFRHALDRRHHPATAEIPSGLLVIARNKTLRTHTSPKAWLDTDALRQAGMTWEDALSAVGDKVDKAELWSALIPTMPIMAQLRNLRSFDQARVPDKIVQQVADRLTDPQEIARSRQFPFRFLAAYRATSEGGSLRWAYPLEQALGHSLANVPSLNGRTLILVDRSPSMFPQYDRHFPPPKIKGISRADQAAIFGCALALRAENPTLVQFGGGSKVIKVPRESSVLSLVDRFDQIDGTDIPSAVKLHYDNHDRVVVLTDEQSRPGYFPSNMHHYGGMRETTIDALVPLDVPVYMWNFAGYSAAAMASGSNARFTFGGLTDSAFRLIPLLESGAEGVWPWQMDGQSH